MRFQKWMIALLITAFVAVTAQGATEGINLRHTITVEVVQKTKDAIVNIASSSIRAVKRRVATPFGPDPFLDSFSQVVQVPVNSLGTGFVIHQDGYVVTNNHVIDRAREITVELADGRKLPADLVSSDPDADLAILRIKPDRPLPVLELGDSSDLLIGEPAIAVGNPLGFSHSVSTGIVSAVHRDLKGDGDTVLLADLIQTDAAINPGNSGGPLLNAYGQVIGINTAIRGDAQNIGFAIPINRLRDLIPHLLEPAQVNKLSIPIKLKEERKLSPPANVKAEVHIEEKPDAAAVISIDGRPINNIVDAYVDLLRVKSASDQVVIGMADGKELRLDVKAVPLPDAVVQARKELGLTLEQVTPMVAKKMGLHMEQGLLVTAVAHDSVAERAHIEPGDVIFQLGRFPIRTLKDLAGLLPHIPAAGRVNVGVVRGEQYGFAVLHFGV